MVQKEKKEQQENQFSIERCIIPYTMSVKTAAQYYGIGEKKIRKLIQEDPDRDFILWNSSHVRIKRKQFEQFIDEANAI